MWAGWVIPIVLVGIVLSLFAFAGWAVAIPVAIVILGAAWATRGVRKRHEGVEELRQQARSAEPLDKGGVEFTDRDRETLST